MTTMPPASILPGAPIGRVLLATVDPMFAVLCKRAFHVASPSQPFLAVTPPELLEAVRQFAPDLLLLDADGQDVPALKTLAAKVMLLSDASLVLVSAYLGPGSAGLGALLQSIPAAFVHKPQGPSSLGLAGADGPPFVAAVTRGLTANLDESEPAVEGVDAGWDIEEESAKG